jgi:hypothetical protein
MAISRHVLSNSYYSLVPEWKDNIRDCCDIEKSRIVQLRNLEASIAELSSDVAQLTAIKTEKETAEKELKVTQDFLHKTDLYDADRTFYSRENNRSKVFSLPLHISGRARGTLEGKTYKFTHSTQWRLEVPTFRPATEPNRIVYHEDLLIPIESTFDFPHLHQSWTVKTVGPENPKNQVVQNLQITSANIIDSDVVIH